MKFVVTDKTKQPPIHKKVFVIIVKAMHGDGDHYDDVEFGPFIEAQTQEMEKIIKTLDLMIKEEDIWEYKSIPGYKELFGYSSGKRLYRWPNQIGHDEAPAYADGYNVFWYDANGIKYNVEIKKGEDEND